MAVWDHWQPLPNLTRVTTKPIEVLLCGRSLCLFRTHSGQLAALDNACPHRRLKLSVGRVVGETVECKYHGWTFDACGRGESPGTPKMTTCTNSYDVREQHDRFWIKARGAEATFPIINPHDHFHLGTFDYVVQAPLELTLDNFTEIEHTGTVHTTFGYELARMNEVTVRTESTPTTVRVVNAGPTKRLNPIIRRLLGVRKNDLFHDDWTIHFSPVHSVFDHWWSSPDGARESMVRWRFTIFFTPLTATTTGVIAFVHAKSKYPGPNGGLRLAKPFFRREIDREMRADVAMLGHLADYESTLEGMKLSRFDKVMGLTRERIRTIYRGERDDRISLAAG